MSGFEFLKFVHVLAMAAWVGGGMGIFVLQSRMRAAGDRQGLALVGRRMEELAKLYYSPLSITTLVTGIWMVLITDGFTFEQAWIAIGIAGVVVTTALGIAVISPTGRKMLEESAKPQPDPAAMAGLGRRLQALSVTNLTILVVVVWAMVAKPGL